MTQLENSKQDLYIFLSIAFAAIAVFTIIISVGIAADNSRNQELLDCLNRDNEPEWCVEHFG